MSEHLLEMAKALVRVRDGKVDVLTDPQVSAALCEEAFTALLRRVGRR